MKTTLTTEIINNKMIPLGFKLLTPNYINNYTVMEWECQVCKKTFPDKLINLQRSLRCKCCNGVKKHTIKSIKEEFLPLGFELLSIEYIDNTTEMLWKHIKCGEIFPCGLRNMQRALFCRVCEGPKEYTIEEIREQIKPFNIFLLSEEYINQDLLLQWVCTHCGHEWNKSRTKMTDHTFCPECRDDKPLSMLDINKRVSKRPFKCITEGIHMRSEQVEWQCTNEDCQHTWFRSFSETEAWGGDCSECRPGRRHTVKNIRERLRAEERNIILITDLPEDTLINSKTVVKWKCLIDGYEWDTTVGSVISGGSGCGKCSGNIRFTIEEVEQKVFDLGLNFKLLTSNYINTQTAMKWECLDCGLIFPRTLIALLTKAPSCPDCGDGNYTSTNITNAERNKEEWLKVPAIVYKLYCWNDTESFNKIGNTTRTVKLRFSGKSNMPYEYNIIEEIYTNRYEATYLEEKLKDEHKEFQYIPKIHFGGYKECFSKLLP